MRGRSRKRRNSFGRESNLAPNDNFVRHSYERYPNYERPSPAPRMHRRTTDLVRDGRSISR